MRIKLKRNSKSVVKRADFDNDREYRVELFKKFAEDDDYSKIEAAFSNLLEGVVRFAPTAAALTGVPALIWGLGARAGRTEELQSLIDTLGAQRHLPYIPAEVMEHEIEEFLDEAAEGTGVDPIELEQEITRESEKILDKYSSKSKEANKKQELMLPGWEKSLPYLASILGGSYLGLRAGGGLAEMVESRAMGREVNKAKKRYEKAREAERLVSSLLKRKRATKTASLSKEAKKKMLKKSAVGISSILLHSIPLILGLAPLGIVLGAARSERAKAEALNLMATYSIPASAAGFMFGRKAMKEDDQALKEYNQAKDMVGQRHAPYMVPQIHAVPSMAEMFEPGEAEKILSKMRDIDPKGYKQHLGSDRIKRIMDQK